MNKNQINQEINDSIYLFNEIKSPLQIGYLVDKCLKYEHIIATLLKFVDKKYVKVEPIYKNNQIESYKLEKNNSNILDEKYYQYFIKEKEIGESNIKELSKFGVTISEVYVINRIIFNDRNEITIKDIREFYDDKNCIGYETEELKSKYLYTSKLIVKELELFKLVELKLESNLNVNLNLIKFTKLGKKQKKEWKKFSKNLKENTLLSERELESLVIWGEYLALGVALSICEVTISEISKLYNQAH